MRGPLFLAHERRVFAVAQFQDCDADFGRSDADKVSVFTSFAAIDAATTNVGASAVITISAGNTITIAGVLIGDLSAKRLRPLGGAFV